MQPNSNPTASSAAAPQGFADIAREFLNAHTFSATLAPVSHADFLMEQRRLREAIAQALAPQGKVVATFAEEMRKALPILSEAHAREAVAQTCARRAAEQQQFLKLLTSDTRFHAAGRLKEADVPQEKDPTDKFVEILAQPKLAGGPEPIIHILAQADGQERWHAALIECWKPGGKVHAALEASLKELAPDLRPEMVEFAADHFIRNRHKRAVMATKLMSAESHVVQKAIAISMEAAAKKQAAGAGGTALTETKAMPEKESSSVYIGKALAFGGQQTAACFSTDFIDPPVSRYLQNRYGVPEHEVTHGHVWYGEIIGDLSALPLYLAEKVLLREPLKAAADFCQSFFGSSYEKSGKKHLKCWAEKHGVDENSQEYKDKLEEYKRFQAENAVDSSLVALNATTVNVLSQKYVLHNHQPLKVILGSKLVGAAATMSLMLGLRRVAPTATESLDHELSERYFAPVIRHVQTQLGFKPEMPSEEDAPEKPAPPEPHHVNAADAAVAGAAMTAVGLLGHADGWLNLKKPSHVAALAATGAAGALGLRAIAPETMEHLNNELNNRYLSPKRKEKPEKLKERWAERSLSGGEAATIS